MHSLHNKQQVINSLQKYTFIPNTKSIFFKTYFIISLKIISLKGVFPNSCLGNILSSSLMVTK